MMRILIVAHNLVRGDGQGRINYEIVLHTLRDGHSVTLLADQVSPELVERGAQWIAVQPKIRKPNLLKVSRFVVEVDAYIRAHSDDFDVIVGNGFVLTEPHDVNLCQFVHGVWVKSPVHVAKLRRGPYAWYQSAYSNYNSVRERKAFGASRYVIAPSRKIISDLTQIGVPSDKIKLIYNGVDVNEFLPESVDRAAVGLWPDGPLAVFAGDIRTPRKNLDSVLKALAIVPQLRLVVVGELAGSPFPELARSLGVANRVNFLGYRRDVQQIMRACDFFVFPSRYEAGALVILEALACGLPIISAKSAGGAELVEAGAGVVLDDSEDVNALATAMRTFADETNLRRKMSLAARAIAEQHTWADMASGYLRLFEECAGENSGGQSQLRDTRKSAAIC